MTARIPNSLERLSHPDLVGLVRDLIHEVTRLRAENEKLVGVLAKLKIEHQAVKDELARLKHLPPRPPGTTSLGHGQGDGREKAERAAAERRAGVRRGGAAVELDKLTIGATVVVRAKAPAGSRHKGYEDIVVQDLGLRPLVTRYRRERWETPDGETIIAELNSGIVGGYGPNLNRLVLALHFAGQMTCERIVALLNGMGVVISKRQVVRLLTVKLETFRAEDAAVLKAAERRLCHGRRYRGAPRRQERLHHADRLFPLHGVSHWTLQVAPGVSVAAFGGTSLYVINDAALAYMKGRDLSQIVMNKLIAHRARIFASSGDWERHLRALALSETKVLPDPVLIASEAALWGAIHHQGLLQDTVIVSDDAGQFRVGAHALCWVRAERLVHKLIPATDKQRNAVEVADQDDLVVLSLLERLQALPQPRTGRTLARPLRAHLQARPNRVRHARQPAQTPPSPQRRTVARARAAGNPPQHQRLGKRHPRLRHQAKNIRRNRKRPRPRRPRHHARPGQNLHEIEIVVLRLHRRPTGNPRPQNPAPREPRQARPRLSQPKLARKSAPVTWIR